MASTLRRLAAPLVVLSMLALAACGGSSGSSGDGLGDVDESLKKGASAPCTAAQAPALNPSALVPSDVPVPTGTTFYSVETAGETSVHYGYVDGIGVQDARDAIEGVFDNAGYTIESSDQEGDYEAEFEFDGRHRGSLQVSHLCISKLRLRYRLES